MADYSPAWIDQLLRNILDKMKHEGDNGDWEIAHSNADDYLIEALKLLAGDEHETVVEQIVAAWENVGKWYA